MEELINNEVDYMLVIVPFIAELVASDIPDKTLKLRLDAIKQLQSRLACYKELGYMEKLLCAIARKKAAMIMSASSKTEMEKVMSIRPPYFDGNKFIPDQYNVPEEEIIAWSQTSLQAPLSEAGFSRYKELFGQIFPEQAKEIF